MKQFSFEDYAVVACGTLRLELAHLQEEGFFNPREIFHTIPGLHETPAELKKQLLEKIRQAKEIAGKIIVVFGGKYCYMNKQDPYDDIDRIIDKEKGEGFSISRIKANRCFDMLIDEEKESDLESKVVWLTPGWVKYQKLVYKNWDKAIANSHFPKHTGGAVLLDGINFFNDYSLENPEAVLSFSDWMGIPINPRNIKLDRFKELLIKAAQEIT